MIGGLAAGATLGTTRGGSSQRTQRQPEETPSPEATPLVDVRSYEGEPELSLDLSKEYFADVETPKGNIRIQLFDDEAPRAVNSFVFLAREGFYNGLTFHIVRPDAGFALSGDPSCDAAGELPCRGDGSPGYVLPLEENSQSHVKATVAMASVAGGNDISGSQFYILLRDDTRLDGRDTVFGEVVEGLDVVEALTPRNPCFEPPSEDNPCDESPSPGDEIISVTIEEV